MASKRWAIVLAGGEGERMQAMIKFWMGRYKPKQYCAFTGRRSMLEHTLDRVENIVPDERIVTVIGHGHRAYLEEAVWKRLPGRVVEQPGGRGTLPGILLPLRYVMKSDPEATVLLFPSDHFVYPEGRFVKHVDKIAEFAERFEGSLALLGATPDEAEPDYGWIEPGRRTVTQGAATVARFHEKPAPKQARQFFSLGYLWNTMIAAVKARTLWGVTAQLHPQMARRFEALGAALGTPQECGIIDNIYDGMPAADFSRDILEKASDRILVRALEGVEWSDWGRPARVVDTLTKIGRVPAFPMGVLELSREYATA